MANDNEIDPQVTSSPPRAPPAMCSEPERARPLPVPNARSLACSVSAYRARDERALPGSLSGVERSRALPLYLFLPLFGGNPRGVCSSCRLHGFRSFPHRTRRPSLCVRVFCSPSRPSLLELASPRGAGVRSRERRSCSGSRSTTEHLPPLPSSRGRRRAAPRCSCVWAWRRAVGAARLQMCSRQGPGRRPRSPPVREPPQPAGVTSTRSTAAPRAAAERGDARRARRRERAGPPRGSRARRCRRARSNGPERRAN